MGVRIARSRTEKSRGRSFDSMKPPHLNKISQKIQEPRKVRKLRNPIPKTEDSLKLICENFHVGQKLFKII